MVTFIILIIIVLTVFITAFSTRDPADTAVAFLLACAASAVLMMIAGPAINADRDPDGGWTRVGEKTYTLAEGSEVVTTGDRVEIIAVIDDNLKPVAIENIGEVIFSKASTHKTVVIQEEFRDVGTAIFWWGEGQSRSIAVVR